MESSTVFTVEASTEVEFFGLFYECQETNIVDFQDVPFFGLLLTLLLYSWKETTSTGSIRLSTVFTSDKSDKKTSCLWCFLTLPV